MAGSYGELMPRRISIILFTAAASTLCFAQTDSASLRVFVQDASESAVSGARVQIRNAGTAVELSAPTSADGYAFFSPVVRGTYELLVAKAGFKSVRLTGVSINVDERRLVRVKLDVASVSETIEVSERASPRKPNRLRSAR